MSETLFQYTDHAGDILSVRRHGEALRFRADAVDVSIDTIPSLIAVLTAEVRAATKKASTGAVVLDDIERRLKFLESAVADLTAVRVVTHNGN